MSRYGYDSDYRNGERDFERKGSHGYDYERYHGYDENDRDYRDGFDEARRAEERRREEIEQEEYEERRLEYEIEQRRRAEERRREEIEQEEYEERRREEIEQEEYEERRLEYEIEQRRRAQQLQEEQSAIVEDLVHKANLLRITEKAIEDIRSICISTQVKIAEMNAIEYGDDVDCEGLQNGQ